MCYTVLLSTTSPEDLSAHSCALLSFHRNPIEEPASLLLYEQKWYVGSRSGCGCTFRHAMDPGLGFGKPVDWFPEEADELAATAVFAAVVRTLLESGHQIDCIDCWAGAAAGGIVRTDVCLDDLADAEFRFFENHHFVFTRRGDDGRLPSASARHRLGP